MADDQNVGGNQDINEHLKDASLDSNLNSLDFSRLVIQL